ncbi:ACP S-malonyltransferase [Sediminibacillus massiliensis]|uniref:ACP S-malonyltransferase n=1 Tax=Sediminibacillus massiliensis TaxID=1926277 RepID=UPI0009889068|nr:ACP S-malonyltransferase [Sediminibacillus massiliensis]
MKRVAFVFPGQGSQSVGMGKDIYEQVSDTNEYFDYADEVCGISLTSIMFEGPKETLTKTENAQPALLLTSVLLSDILKKEGVRPVMTAGHSLGEYSALVAAGALTIKDALPLVRHRGQLMEKAYPEGKGAMAAVLGGELETIEQVLKNIRENGQTVQVANLNCPGQVVISGTKTGIDKAAEDLKEAGIKRVLPLNVSGPFHSQLMKPATEEFKSALQNAAFDNAEVPVYANVTAQPVIDKQEIPELLIQQLYSPVRFQEIVENMIKEDIDAIVEIGNGKVLTGLVKKIDRRMKTFSVQDLESLSEFVEWYKEES